MAKATFKVTWTDFTVLKKHDVDRDRPYLWVFGIVVDATSIQSENYVIRKPCTSDNLGQKFKKGDSVAVPGSLDISREITPILLGKATAGVVVVAWENAMTKDSVIADAYDAAADTINEFVKEAVPAALGELFEAVAAGTPIDEIEVGLSDAQMKDLEADVEARVRATIKEGWSVFQLVHDHLIGLDKTVVTLEEVTLEEPFEQCLDYRFISGSTDYNLEGDMSYRLPVPRTGNTLDPVDNHIKNQEQKPYATK
jgi:hypothetical protein